MKEKKRLEVSYLLNTHCRIDSLKKGLLKRSPVVLSARVPRIKRLTYPTQIDPFKRRNTSKNNAAMSISYLACRVSPGRGEIHCFTP